MSEVTNEVPGELDHLPETCRFVPVRRGKNPGSVLGKDWQDRLKAGTGEIRKWVDSGFDVGLLLGQTTGVIDIEYDSAEGKENADRLLGNIATPSFRSSRSVHRLFQWPEEFSGLQSAWRTRDGVEYRIGGLWPDGRVKACQSLLPPSRSREWLDGLSPSECDLASLPDLLVEYICDIFKSGNGGDFGSNSGDLEQCKEYLEAMPESVSGANGSVPAFAAACAIYEHGLDGHCARLAFDHYNETRCSPPWTDAEIEHKLADARTRVLHSGKFGSLIQETADEDFECLVTEDSAVSGELPAHLLEVPGFVSELVNYTESCAHRSQPALSLGGALSLLGVLCGRYHYCEKGNGTNLLVINSSASGTGKEHARAINNRILSESGYGELMLNGDVASDTALLRSFQSSPSVLLQVDEFGRAMKSASDERGHLFKLVTLLMELYNSYPGHTLTRNYAQSKNNIRLSNPHLNLLACTTPTTLFESLTEDSISSGFIPRLLVFEGDDLPERKRGLTAPIPQSILDAVKQYRFRAEFDDEASTLKYDPEAENMLMDFESTCQLSGDKVGEPYRAIWVRAPQKACRLAVLHALSRSPFSDTITAGDMLWGRDLVQHLTLRTLHLCSQWMYNGEFDEKQKNLMRRVVADGLPAYTKTQLCLRSRAWNRRIRDDVIDNLLATRQLRSFRGLSRASRKSVQYYCTPDNYEEARKLHPDE